MMAAFGLFFNLFFRCGLLIMGSHSQNLFLAGKTSLYLKRQVSTNIVTGNFSEFSEKLQTRQESRADLFLRTADESKGFVKVKSKVLLLPPVWPTPLNGFPVRRRPLLLVLFGSCCNLAHHPVDTQILFSAAMRVPLTSLLSRVHSFPHSPTPKISSSASAPMAGFAVARLMGQLIPQIRL